MSALPIPFAVLLVEIAQRGADARGIGSDNRLAPQKMTSSSVDFRFLLTIFMRFPDCLASTITLKMLIACRNTSPLEVAPVSVTRPSMSSFILGVRSSWILVRSIIHVESSG